MRFSHFIPDVLAFFFSVSNAIEIWLHNRKVNGIATKLNHVKPQLGYLITAVVTVSPAIVAREAFNGDRKQF